MIGKWTWNLYAALGGAVLIFLFSIRNNLVSTTLLRSFYAFICFFVLVYIVRFLLGTAAGLRELNAAEADAEESGVGGNIDLATPEEGGMPLTAPAAEEEDAFKPLTSMPLQNIPSTDPKKVAAAVRKMSEP
jgi:hypothetical protein